MVRKNISKSKINTVYTTFTVKFESLKMEITAPPPQKNTKTTVEKCNKYTKRFLSFPQKH